MQKRTLLNDLHILDLETITWDEIDAVRVPPSPRSDHAAAVHVERYLLIFGGGSHATCYNDLHVLDLQTMEWSRPTQQEFEKSRISDLLHMVQASLKTAESNALVMKQKISAGLKSEEIHSQQHNESFSSLDHLEAELQQLNSKNHDLTQEIVKLGTLSGEPCTVVNTGSLATDIEVGLLHDESNDHHIGRLISKVVNIGNDAVTIDKGESSIISNILSINFDPWDDSITSPHNIVKLLSDNTDSQPASNSLRATHSIASSNKLSAISRVQVSAPPGFSIPSWLPPPGFSSHDRS
ncbi:hypothetical protein KIW84_011295 [Lathyrus oleraceus]|uniref:Uncharacterized protein n=1 Tax=Pisum sativum TaxID=3888 RepID=A0A9D4YQB9_PEA|nr:hypothetical protein KIW84_011295 [Pisum sativum]